METLKPCPFCGQKHTTITESNTEGIVEGDFKGSLIFMNQVINQGFQIHIVNELLRDITGEMDNPPEIAFHTYRQYGELLMDIAEAIDGNFEYSVKYGENKGFNTFKIEEVYVLVDD